jgi:hypothetical protein
MADATSAGDYEPGTQFVYVDKKDGSSIVKGDVCDRNGNSGFRTAPTTGAIGPFVLCVKSAGASLGLVSVCDKGIVYLTSGGTINPGSLVVPDSGTAGRVKAYVATTVNATPAQSDVTNARDEHRLIVGRYMGKLGENDGKTAPSAATTADVIRVRFFGGF